MLRRSITKTSYAPFSAQNDPQSDPVAHLGRSVIGGVLSNLVDY